MRSPIPFALPMSALLFVVACGADKDDAAEEAAKVTPSVAAAVDTVRVGAFSETVDGVGAVVARTGHVASLAAPAPTRIAKIYVALGDHVAANAPLVDFEQPAFDAAVASADAALRAAELAAARATRLVEAGVVPRKDAEAATADLEAARLAAVTARRARELAHVTAPFAGVVTRLSVAMGANVDVGQPLVEITDPSLLDVVVPVAPGDAGHIRAGQTARLFEGTGADTVAIGDARVADVSAVVDSLSRGVPVRLSLGRTARVLRIGESVFARVLVSQHTNAIVIADDALVPTGEGFHVFVVDSAGVAHARPVTVGARMDHRIWVSEGLKAGEVIVTKGAYGMDEGARVVGGKP